MNLPTTTGEKPVTANQLSGLLHASGASGFVLAINEAIRAGLLGREDEEPTDLGTRVLESALTAANLCLKYERDGMTPEQRSAYEKAQVMLGFSDGKNLERTTISNSWMETSGPCWNWDHRRYRLAPTDPEKPETDQYKRFRDALGVPGKRVRVQLIDKWFTCTTDEHFNHRPDRYRVEKLIPWTAEDMKPGMWVRKNCNNAVSAVSGWSNEAAGLAFGWHTYAELLRDFTDVTNPKNPRECGRWVPDEEAK